jgi:adenylate cyclase class 2
MSDVVEIEVKFFLPEVRTVRDRILAVGATFVGKHFETNTCFENEARSFKEQDMLLRLRKDDKTRLTFKIRPTDSDKAFKMYREMEVEVDDFETCQAILENLGFHPQQTYEKWRETFVLGDTKLLIDTTPYGVFLEIEGSKPDISDLAERLDLKWEERILLNYLAIFEILHREESLPFSDMTFDNFNVRPVNVEAYLHLLYPE